MRLVVFCFVALAGLAQLSNAATISAVIKGSRAGGNPGEAFLNYSDQSSVGGSQGTFGTINVLGGPPDDNSVLTQFVNGSYNFGNPGNDGKIETTVRRQGYKFFSTTHAYFVPASGFVGGIRPMVVNSGYWEFTVDGIFDYEIKGQAPQISEPGPPDRGNIRTYRFEKVGGGTLAEDTVGKTATTFSGTDITSGIYRLYYDHYNFSPNLSGPAGNIIGGTNLDIAFTFKGEDNAPVPEPASIAVFSLLGLGTLASKMRRKK